MLVGAVPCHWLGAVLYRPESSPTASLASAGVLASAAIAQVAVENGSRRWSLLSRIDTFIIVDADILWAGAVTRRTHGAGWTSIAARFSPAGQSAVHPPGGPSSRAGQLRCSSTRRAEFPPRPHDPWLSIRRAADAITAASLPLPSPPEVGLTALRPASAANWVKMAQAELVDGRRVPMIHCRHRPSIQRPILVRAGFIEKSRVIAGGRGPDRCRTGHGRAGHARADRPPSRTEDRDPAVGFISGRAAATETDRLIMTDVAGCKITSRSSSQNETVARRIGPAPRCNRSRS